MTFPTVSKRERAEEIYSYCGGTIIEARKLDLLTKAASLLLLEETTSFHTVCSKDTSIYVQENMEIDIPGKTIRFLCYMFINKVTMSS